MASTIDFQRTGARIVCRVCNVRIGVATGDRVAEHLAIRLHLKYSHPEAKGGQYWKTEQATDKAATDTREK